MYSSRSLLLGALLALPLSGAVSNAVTWKDREVLHGRNAFVASAASERFLWKCAVDVGVFA